MVEDADFREDLLFRISGVTIAVPPLRERSAEIREPATTLLAEECVPAAKPKASFSPAALVLLESHRWPGNVRELRSTIERALLVARGSTIGADDIVLRDAGPGGDASVATPGERARIEAVLDRCGGNQTEAAKMLGISRRLLGQRLDHYGIKRPRKR